MMIKKAYRHCILCIILLLPVTAAYTQNWDIDLLKKINPDDPSSAYWQATSASGYLLPAVGIIGTFVKGTIDHNKSLQKNSYQALIAIGGEAVISEILKISINRTRPAYAYPDDITEGGNKSKPGHSFPSGHTGIAFNYATTLSLEYKKWYIVAPAYAWAASVGYSRLYLGKHYPSDVIAGALLGTASGWLSYKLTNKWLKLK
jgi:membrane-associated phospholipid phosphatase